MVVLFEGLKIFDLAGDDFMREFSFNLLTLV